MEYERPNYFQMIWTPIASIGWYIVGLVIIAYYIFPHVQKKYKNWKQYQEDAGTAHQKKTDELSRTSVNLQIARQKLQESYRNSSALAQLKEKEEKEKKRQKTLDLLKNKDVGNRLGNGEDDATSSTSWKSKSFKSDYNPLMGDSTRGYRPPKRSCCGKGGCG